MLAENLARSRVSQVIVLGGIWDAQVGMRLRRFGWDIARWLEGIGW